VIVACAIMFAVEFVADKIPGFDMIWNALHTVVRIPIAALVAYHASSHLSPQMQIASAVLGGAVALAAHSSKTAIRAVVTPSPEPVSNIALSTTEDALAVGLTWFATHHPFIAASMALILLATAALAARSLLRAIRRPLRRWLRLDEEQQTASAKPRS
jgi:hypothetical protein